MPPGRVSARYSFDREVYHAPLCTPGPILGTLSASPAPRIPSLERSLDLPSMRTITTDDLFRLKVPQSVHVSPDGERVVYIVKRADGKKNTYAHDIHIMKRTGGGRRQLTHGKSNDTGALWSPDGKRIAFLSDRTDDVTNIWTMPADGGEPKQLTKLKGGPIMGMEWSPDGKSLLFLFRDIPKKDPEQKKREASFKHVTRLYHKLDGMGWYADARWNLCVASFPSGRRDEAHEGRPRHHRGDLVPGREEDCISHERRGEPGRVSPQRGHLRVRARREADPQSHRAPRTAHGDPLVARRKEPLLQRQSRGTGGMDPAHGPGPEDPGRGGTGRRSSRRA